MKAVGRQKPRNRQRLLDQGRRQKMARSAHAYVRGNTAQFYEWLASTPGHALPRGPGVWICGDCHLGNLGPVADAKGRIQIQIRDLDQTVIGNPAHDLVRLGLSLAMAARGSNLPGITTAYMLENMIKGYEAGLSHGVPDDADIPEPIDRILQQAFKRRWRNLAEERIKDVTPTIPLGRRFWALTVAENKEITRLVALPETQELITCMRHRHKKDELVVLDAAYWIKGCSSLGRLRYAVLIGIGKHSNFGKFCLVDIKEAVVAAAPRYAKSSMPRDNAKRVVEGARNLSPFLGERMLAARFLDRSVVIRELLPQDLKLAMERLTQEEAIAAAHFLAAVVGKAHARQMEASPRNEWRRDLNLCRTKTLDAPSWLWRSVVELVSSHELAYLEHCRRCTVTANI
jgi:uncharacterized protein (DUF2252 family)